MPQKVARSFVITIGDCHWHNVVGLRTLEPFCSVLYAALEFESHYHIQVFFTLKHEVGPKPFNWVHRFFPTTNKDWVTVAKGTKKANHEYIIRGIGQNGMLKSFSQVFWNKDLHEKEEPEATLATVCDLMKNGESLKNLMFDNKFVNIIAKNMTFLREMEAHCAAARRSVLGERDSLRRGAPGAPRSGCKAQAESEGSTAVRGRKRIRDLADFNRTLEIGEKLVVIWGPAGTGKTQWAKAHFEKPLLVSSVDGLKDFDDHDGIIFDDMDFSHWPREAMIHLCDYEEDRPIHCRYKDFIKPAGTRVVVTTNKHGGCVFGDYMADPAIARRIEVIEVKESLF